MARSSSSRLLDFDPEIDRTCLRKLKSAQEVVRSLNFDEHSPIESGISRTAVNKMADNQRKMMVEYARPTLDGTGSSVVKPVIEANNFEVKASTMNMIYT